MPCGWNLKSVLIMSMTITDKAYTWLNQTWARLISFVLACALSVLIFIYPNAIATSVNDIQHSILMLIMWGISGGFVHGVGYIPVHRIWRILLGPPVSWFLLCGGVTFLLLNH